MADFTVLGHISTIKYLPESILIYVDEYKKGYRKADGEVVDDKVLSWRCIFSGNASKRNYITKYFSRGSLVQVKGEFGLRTDNQPCSLSATDDKTGKEDDCGKPDGF